MLKHFIVRFLLIIPMLLFISVIIYAGLQMAPGNPLTYLIPPDIDIAVTDMEALEKAMGLDAPPYVLYFRWLGNMFQGKFGYSLVNGADIGKMIATRLPATLELVTVALLVSTILGILFGIIASIKQNSLVDYSNTILGVIGISIPEFFLGIVCIKVFALSLGWLPIGGRLVYGANFWGRMPNLVMPSLILGIALIASLMRYTRSSMLV